MLKNISAVTVALILLLFQGWQATAAQKMLEDINFESSGNGEDRIIFKLNGTYIPKIFTLQGKQPRVVFDFQDTTAAKVINNIINTNGELIKRIRVGIHKGDTPKTRVVLDLRPNKNINIRQDFDNKEKALVVSVHYAGLKQSAEPKEPVEKTAAASPEQLEEKQEPEVVEEQPEPAVQAEEKIPQQEKKKAESQTAEQPPKQEAKEVEENPGVPTLTSVTFENNSNRGEMVLFKLNEFHPPIVFGIEEGTPRVVCDFKDTVAAKDIPDSIKIAGKYIQKIRVGKDKKENKVRVVLDLIPNYSYDLQQVFFKEENLFVIIINTLGNAPTGDPSELLN
ncbi:MAG: AMIN domain-containing protein [Candidatus Electrothrix sp. GW3-4]|uniref:AMIN domain-containing protein n=1 Tax=Candidatus Electrothrix sp. GW3-4 TaxID=3126740 RepID=UPI0030CE9603